MNNNQTSGILKQRIETSHIHITQITAPIFTDILGQEESSGITLLLRYKLRYLFYLRCIDKRTLHTNRIGTLQEQHISPAYQLVGSRTVENGTRVHHSRYTESDTCREVRFNRTCYNIRRRTLGSDNHMDTYRTGQLGNTGNRQFNLLAGSHDQVTELIDHHDDIRHKLVPLFRIQTTIDKLLVIFLYIAHMCHFQQVIAGVHLHTDRV